MKPIPIDAVRYEMVKLKVGDLRKGMFVCELDRPWEDTPFLFEGFELETDEDIEAVRRHCDYVYIDLGRTQVVNVKIEEGPEHSFMYAQGRASLEKEMAAAEATKKNTSGLVKSFADDIRFGNSIDVKMAKHAVSQCVESVLRNPDAMMLLTWMKDKNPMISKHAFNVCVYSIILGRLLGYDAGQLEDIGTCGLLHDIGNVAIPAELLNKTTPLSEEEFSIIKEHTTRGRDILMSARNIYDGAVDVAYGHHECPDGSGYPRGLKDQQINQYCRIVGVVDKYEAITRHTPYRSAQNHLDAVHLLNLLADHNKIDKQLCATFVSYLGFYPPGTIVDLSTGEVAIVLKSNSRQRLRPQVLIVRDAERNPIERFVDLAKTTLDEKGKPYKIRMVHLPGYSGIDLAQYQKAVISAYD